VGLRNIAGKSGADYLRIVGGFSLRRGKKGVGEVAKCYYGQFSEIFQDIALELEHDHAGASSLLEC
jgi:hypothetical protein